MCSGGCARQWRGVFTDDFFCPEWGFRGIGGRTRINFGILHNDVSLYFLCGLLGGRQHVFHGIINFRNWK